MKFANNLFMSKQNYFKSKEKLKIGFKFRLCHSDADAAAKRECFSLAFWSKMISVGWGLGSTLTIFILENFFTTKITRVASVSTEEILQDLTMKIL